MFVPALIQAVRHLLTNIQSAMQKTDTIIEANPGVSLDELVASRKINADQKASAEKKPGLQAQRAQLEEQFGHFQKYGQEQEEKAAREKEILKKSHSSELEALRHSQGRGSTGTEEALEGENPDTVALLEGRCCATTAGGRRLRPHQGVRGRATPGVRRRCHGSACG